MTYTFVVSVSGFCPAKVVVMSLVYGNYCYTLEWSTSFILVQWRYPKQL